MASHRHWWLSPVYTPESECHALRTENILLKDKIKKTSFDQIGLENNDKKVDTLTGIPTYTLLIIIFNVITHFLKPKSDLSPFQQYIMTLMRLRMKFSFEFLAYYFNVDPTTVSKLFKHCINVMYCKLVPSLVSWPDRDVLRLSLPYLEMPNVVKLLVLLIVLRSLWRSQEIC